MEDKIMSRIVQLLAKPKMLERDGDSYKTKLRVRGCFNACELYRDPKVGMTEGEVFHYLNGMVNVKRMHINGLHYELIR